MIFIIYWAMGQPWFMASCFLSPECIPIPKIPEMMGQMYPVVSGLLVLVNHWLVVWNMNFIFPLILGISSSQLTNSYFSEGWPNHQPDQVNLDATESRRSTISPGRWVVGDHLSSRACAAKFGAIPKFWTNPNHMTYGIIWICYNICFFFIFYDMV